MRFEKKPYLCIYFIIMNPDQKHNLPILKRRRRKLRIEITPAEELLWKVIKNRQFKDLKFRRQHSIEYYIVDFYCPSLKLIIELDGEGHFNEENKKYDSKRDKKLNELGYKVLRYENRLIFENLQEILNDIAAKLNL